MKTNAVLVEVINQRVMTAKAWNYVLGRSESELQAAIMWLFAKKEARGRVTTTELTEIISLAIDKTANVARERMNQMREMGVAQQTREMGSNVRYWSLTPEGQNAVYKLSALFRDIRDVVAAQRANTSDSRAGSQLVPKEVYYNVLEKPEGQKDLENAA